MKKFVLRFTFASFVFLCFCLAAQAQSSGSTAITNARIVTGSGATVEKGTVVLRDGLIEAVGENVKAPADARVFDGNGLTIYPGFFDTNTNLGTPAPTPRPQGAGQGFQAQLLQQAAQQGQQPQSNSNYPSGLQPEMMVADQLRAGEAQFETQRNNGITTALTVGREGIFHGQSAVINLSGDTVSAMIVKSPFAQHITFRPLSGAGYPNSLMGAFSAIRQMLFDAKRLQDWQKMYAANPRGLKRPDEDKSLEALFPVINGTIPVVMNANSEIEIIRALDLTKEFNLKTIIAGGQEAWKVADRLKAQNIPVLLSLNFPKRTTAASPEADPETLETLRLRAETPKNAAKLAQAGVKFAFQSGGLTNYTDLWANFNKAVENGLSKDAAIRAMTLSAAEIFGVEDRLGSIEQGKIANLVVMRGDVFSKEKTITHVFVDGKLFEQKQPERRPQTPGGMPNRPGGQGTGTTPPTAPRIDASGVWNVTVEIPGQNLPVTFTFKQDGTKITGTMNAAMIGSSEIRNGTITGDSLSFDASVTFGGQTFDITVTGKISGTQISGTLSSPQGPASFSGAKVP